MARAQYGSDGSVRRRDVDPTARDPEAGPDMAETKAKNDIGTRPDCFKNSFQEISFVFMATVAMAMNTFLTGATVVVTASIGKDLGMSQSQITWISASTTLTAGAFQLALGQLSDLIGRRPMFILGFAIFSAGSLIVSFAQNPFWMDIMCGVLGLASAMSVPPAIGILGAAYSVPSRRKNWAFACFSAGNPLGFVAGSIVSGVATRIFNWRAGFILLAIVWVVLTAASFWVVPSVEAFQPAPFLGRFKAAIKKFDSVGTVLTIVGVGMFTAALTLGPADGWASGHVIAMMVVGFFLLVVFVFWESYWPDPLMPLYIWKDRTFSLLIAVTILGMMAFISSNFWLALLLQEVYHFDALNVAVRLLPQVIAGVIWNIVAANILHLVNNTMIMAAASVAYVAACLLLSLQGLNSSYWAFMFPSLILNVFGADLQFNVTNMYVMQSLPSHQQGLAGGIFNMLIRLGTTIALGISTAVYSSVQKAQAGHGDALKPYQMAIYVSVGLAGLGCLFVPFLRIGTQGNNPAQKEAEPTVSTGLISENADEKSVPSADPISGPTDNVESEKKTDMAV